MKMIRPVVLAGLLVAAAASLSAQSAATARPAATPRTAPPEVATHATKGVVKSVSATQLVIIRREAGKRTETSFGLRPNTQRAGVVAAGSTVEVRYRTEGKQRIATAVSVEDAQK